MLEGELQTQEYQTRVVVRLAGIPGPSNYPLFRPKYHDLTLHYGG